MNSPAKRKATPPDSVLIVEDDPDQQVLTRRQVERSGRNYRIVIASTMQQAMYEVQGAARPFNLILLDRGLPDIINDQAFDDALTRLRLMAPQSHVIINSGNSSPRLTQMAQAHGMAFVHKDGNLMGEVDRIRSEMRDAKQIAAQKSIERERFFIEIAKQDARHDAQLEQLQKDLANKIASVTGSHNEAIADIKTRLSKLETGVAALEKYKADGESRNSERLARLDSTTKLLVIAIPILLTGVMQVATPWLAKMLDVESAKPELQEKK